MESAEQQQRAFRGWGSKQGSKVKTWKQRYFVFDGRDLVYYRAAAYDGSGKDEKGRLTVVGADYAPSLKNGLLVRGDKPGQLLKMRTQDGEHAKQWFQVLKAAAEELKELRGSALFGSFRERAGSSLQRSAPGSYAGWLWVEREDGTGAWVKRYMVLRGKVLSYYSHPSSPSVLHAVRIDAVTVHMSRAFALDLHLGDGEIVTIAGESSEEMQAWERAISTALNTNTAIEFDPPPMVITSPASYQVKQQFSPPHQLFGSPMPDSPTTIARMGRASSVLRCEGWLDKKGSPSSKWHQRYFMLIGGMLTYHHGPKEPVCREEFVVDVQFGDPEATTLEVELESGDSIFVRAASDADQRRWMHALCDLVGKPSLTEDDEEDGGAAPEITGFAYNNNNNHGEQLKPQSSTYSTAEVLFGRRVKRGWLLKEGQFIKSWKRRFFVLDGDTLHYYEVEDGPPKGNGIVMRVLRNTSPANSLDIHCLNGRIIKISADTKEEIDDWFEALREAAASHNTVANDDAAPFLSKGKQQCGWLLKKGQQFKTWKRRYFLLERNRLVYYEAIEGDILGSGVVFDVAMGDARPYCLDVRFQNGRLLQIVAADQEEFTEWFQALQSASNMTESFLSQNNLAAHESLDQEFDYDRGDDVGLDLDFTSEFVGGGVDNNLDDNGDGYSSWAEAMENKPEFGRASSWDSEDGASSDTDATSATGSRNRRGSDASSVGSRSMGCHGWLHKEGGNFKTWKRRYFTLYGNKICYYKRESGAMLRGYHVAQVASHPCKQFMFSMEVTTECGRKLLLAAENKDDYDMWLAALQDAVALADDDPLRLSTRGSQSSASVHASEDGISGGCLSGWLEKEGHRFKTWKRRFFTLKNGALIYYAEPGSAALGHGIVTHVELDSTKPHTLSVHLDTDRVLRVSAESRAELEAWYRALLPSSQEFDDEVLRVSEPQAQGHGHSSSTTTTEQQQAAVRNRFNEGDYLANDTVSNESFLRIRAVDDQKSFLSRSFKKNARSFKGELSFSDTSGDSGTSSQHPNRRVATATVDSDDEDDLAYHRMLLAEQDLALKGEPLPPPHGCAPCCCLS